MLHENTRANLETVVDHHIHTGSVVTLDGSRRRYAITSMDCTGRLSMIALSGGMRGAAPSTIEPSRVRVVAEDRLFRGAKATYLAGRYTMAVRTKDGDLYLAARMALAAQGLPE
jgi:hypothetical protein